jgi:hypothetical protein
MDQQKKLIRLISARADLHIAQEAFYILKAIPTPEQYEMLSQHLFASMVVSYGRPFTENYGVGSIKCDYPNFPDYGDPDLNQIHQRLLDIRHKFLAHSSIEGTKVMIIPPGAPNPANNLIRDVFDHTVGKRTFFLKIEFIDYLYKGIAALKIKLDEDVRALLNEIYRNGSHPNSAFELTTGYEDFKWTE